MSIFLDLNLYKIIGDTIVDTATNHFYKKWLFVDGGLIELQFPFLVNVFKELNRARDASQLNPVIKPMSDRAYKVAVKWILWAYDKYSESLLSPYIVVPGDGGIIIEWHINNNFISLCLDEEDDEMDTIFYRLDDITDSKDFNEQTLEHLINDFIYQNTVSPHYVL